MARKSDTNQPTLKDCATIELPSFKDDRGCLTLIDNEAASKLLPFVPKRCFWIHSINKECSRGEHAHRTCWELVVPVCGGFRLTLNDGKHETTLFANDPTKGIVIPPMVWCRLWDFKMETVCLVLASDDYDPSGYINELDAFLKETSK